MTAQMAIDYFEEPIRASFLKSLALHAMVLGGVVGYVLWQPKVEQFGDVNAGGASVAVTPVSNIPLPTRGRQNPLANDTKSTAPQAPPEQPAPKAAPKQVEEAVPLKAERPTKTKQEVQAEQQKFRPLEPAPNQLTQARAPALADQLFAVSGSGRIGTGMNTTLGTRFAAYAALVRERVAQAWRTGDVDRQVRTAPPAIVTFELLRNGRVRNVRLVQKSGIATLDASVQRAILDAEPFPPLPVTFERDAAVMEFQFELQR